jgi:putative endonuclease
MPSEPSKNQECSRFQLSVTMSTRLASLARGKPPTSSKRADTSQEVFLRIRVECPERLAPSLSRGQGVEWAACLNSEVYFVYMIRNNADKLYVGITKDPASRVRYHNAQRGAHFTKHIPTYSIVFLEQYLDMSSARKREIQIKKWRRDKKEILIARYQKGLPTKS